VCCWLWTLCHTIQHRAVLIIFPLNQQSSQNFCIFHVAKKLWHPLLASPLPAAIATNIWDQKACNIVCTFSTNIFPLLLGTNPLTKYNNKLNIMAILNNCSLNANCKQETVNFHNCRLSQVRAKQRITVSKLPEATHRYNEDTCKTISAFVHHCWDKFSLTIYSKCVQNVCQLQFTQDCSSENSDNCFNNLHAAIYWNISKQVAKWLLITQ